MTRPSSRQEVESLRAVVQSIDERLASGNIPSGDVTELKGAVDDLRLRIWASLSAANSEDPNVLPRFRLRRAAEICRAIVADLESGRIPGDLPDLAALADGARALVDGVASRRSR